MNRWRATATLLSALTAAAVLGGCARGGEGESQIPEVVMDFTVTFSGAVEDAFYYYVAFDADGDFGDDGPVPVAAGPDWGNGWGTGSLTHYVEYHQGSYELFEARTKPELAAAGGGIVGVAGTPDTTDAGVHAITVTGLTIGGATVGGSGAITDVTNDSLQAAGTLTVETDAEGETVADSVAWSPAGEGGRELTAAEQAQIDALNAGGVTLAADSLDALGLSLTVLSSGDRSGTQTITVEPTTGLVTDFFTPDGVGPVRTTSSALPANNDATLDGGPIPGMTIRTADLIVGGTARIRLLPNAVGTSLGFPYESVLPQGGRTLQFTLDLAQLGADVEDLSVNIISTTELIFDPTVVNSDENTYDGLGISGNDFFTFATDEYQIIRDGDGLVDERADDATLAGPADEQMRAAVDIIDWRVSVRRLR